MPALGKLFKLAVRASPTLKRSLQHGIESSSSAKLKGTQMFIKEIGEHKTIKSVQAGSHRRQRWIVFDDDTAMSVTPDFLKRQVEMVSGGRSIRAKLEEDVMSPVERAMWRLKRAQRKYETNPDMHVLWPSRYAKAQHQMYKDQIVTTGIEEYAEDYALVRIRGEKVPYPVPLYDAKLLADHGIAEIVKVQRGRHGK